MPKPHLLSLPTEILQSIYLHSMSPSLPQASPILASALSTDHVYKHTFLHAFWNSTPLSTYTLSPKHSYEPGPHVRTLFNPLPVPLPVPDVKVTDAQARVKMQELVLGYRWCTFNNTKHWLEEIMQAVMKDLLATIDLPLSPTDQTCLASFIAALPASCSSFEASALDGASAITLEYPTPFATAILATYHGADTRFDQDAIPNITIAPTSFDVLPPHVLTGGSEWTQEHIDRLKMLSSFVKLRTVKYQLEAFHQGMRNAVVQGCYDALLTLLRLATRLAACEGDQTCSDATPFEPPAELFRLVVTQGSVASSDACSHCDTSPIAVSLFTLLIRAHAESMPQHDPVIEGWANRLLNCQGSNGTLRAIAKWVLDWNGDGRCSEFEEVWFGTFVGDVRCRMPLFSGGGISRKRRAGEMARRFRDMRGGRVLGFEQEANESGEGK